MHIANLLLFATAALAVPIARDQTLDVTKTNSAALCNASAPVSETTGPKFSEKFGWLIKRTSESSKICGGGEGQSSRNVSEPALGVTLPKISEKFGWLIKRDDRLSRLKDGFAPLDKTSPLVSAEFGSLIKPRVAEAQLKQILRLPQSADISSQ